MKYNTAAGNLIVLGLAYFIMGDSHKNTFIDNCFIRQQYLQVVINRDPYWNQFLVLNIPIYNESLFLVTMFVILYMFWHVVFISAHCVVLSRKVILPHTSLQLSTYPNRAAVVVINFFYWFIRFPKIVSKLPVFYNKTSCRTWLSVNTHRAGPQS